MEELILKTINKYELIKSGDKLVLAVSGGPDSIFMFDVLNKIKKRIDYEFVVCHVNHMIRKEANDDEKFVKDICEKNNIQCFVKRIDVKKYANNNKIGTEEAGRIIRYDFFEEILNKTGSNKIAIAHNKNDKVETIIMNLLRGTGTQGLRGIEPVRDNKYIRPIIEIERKDIERYCKDNNLDPRIDKTNFENIYTRNKIRNIILPYIEKEFNPNIIESLSRLSEIATEEDDYLRKVTENKFSQMLIEQNNHKIVLDLKKFNEQDTIIKKRIVIFTVSRLMGSSSGIEKVHIEDIIKLCENNIGNKFLTPNKNIKFLVNKGKIYIQLQKKY